MLAACGSDTGSDTSSDLPSTSATPTPAPADSAATGAGADVVLHVSGAKAVDVSGHAAAAYCTYYFPADQQGVNVDVRSTDFPGSGDWSLTIQGNDPRTVGLLLAIDSTQFSGNNGDDAATMDQGGTITVSHDVQQTDFNVQLVDIVDHGQAIKVKGSVHCG